MRKRFLSVALSIAMVLGMTVPAFAATETTTKKPVVVAFGDSIGVGFGNDGRHVDFINFDDGVKKHSFSDYPTVKTSYPALVAKKLGGVNEESSYNDVYNALRAKDLCFFLGLIDDEEYYSTVPTTVKDRDGNSKIFSDDWYSQMIFRGQDAIAELMGGDFKLGEMGLDQFIAAAPGKYMASYPNLQAVQKSVREADIITVELGFNDFTAMLSNKGSELVEIILKAATELGKAGEVKDIVQAYKSAKSRDEKVAAISLLVAKAREMGINALGDLKEIGEILGVASQETDKYLDMFLARIREMNSTAKIVLVNMYNPLVNFDIGMAIGLFGVDASTLDLSAFDKFDIMGIMQKLLQPYVNKSNKVVTRLAEKYDCKVADIAKTVTASPGNLFHPDDEGQEAMADAIVLALSDNQKLTKLQLEYEKRTRCKHVDTELQGATDATYFANGYTGNVVCQKCKEVLSLGKEIPMLTLEVPTINKLVKASEKITIKWDTLTDIDGYRLQVSKSTKFGKNTKKVAADSSATSKVVKKLKSGTKYYVRMRAYKNVEDAEGNIVKVYSAWSDTKSLKTK